MFRFANYNDIIIIEISKQHKNINNFLKLKFFLIIFYNMLNITIYKFFIVSIHYLHNLKSVYTRIYFNK